MLRYWRPRMAARRQRMPVGFCLSALVCFFATSAAAWGSLVPTVGVGVTPSGTVEASVGPVEVKATLPSSPVPTVSPTPSPVPTVAPASEPVTQSAPVKSATQPVKSAIPSPSSPTTTKSTASTGQVSAPPPTQPKQSTSSLGSRSAAATSAPAGSGPPSGGRAKLADASPRHSGASSAGGSSGRGGGPPGSRSSGAATDPRLAVRAPIGARALHSPGPSPALASPPSTGDSVLGIPVPADVKHDALLATLIVLAGALILAVAIADDAGIGPRHRAWRAYWSYRLTRR